VEPTRFLRLCRSLDDRDDTQAVAEIKAQSGFDYSADWERQGQTRFWLQGEFPQYSFIDDMWKAYR
jgi:hypothetical protein